MKFEPIELRLDRTHGGAAPSGVLDFSASLNPLGPPPQALAAYHDAAAFIARYPSPDASDLARRLAGRHRVAPDNIVVANGSTQLIHLLARTLRPRCPFVAIPTFSEIANAMIVAGGAACAMQARRERGFAIEMEQVERALERGADAMFIGRPNSPTGAMLSIGDATEIAARCSSRGCWCIFDEAFIDFVGEEHSAIRPVAEDSHVIVLRSLTKMFAIAGLRLGYLVAGRDIARRLGEAIEPWSVNIVAERVGNACLDVADDFAMRSRTLIASERTHLVGALSSIEGIRVYKSSVNFMMLEVAEHGHATRFAQHTLSRGIAVRDLHGLPGCGPGMYRVAVRLREENEQLIAAARAYFD
ncbi:MAG TPA: aminotransferase class I/II-fold pyridoxal phosphate-dependent enzyme [Candidatus Binataceae bacterium]|nr:aminotransferase class I/II-fold pyridoxal phosphate-dependent enzyme [Candidatus Binataceae bacterium]